MGNLITYFTFDKENEIIFTELKNYYNLNIDEGYINLYYFLSESNRYCKNMLNYQKDLPNNFSILIDLNNPNNSTIDLDKCMIRKILYSVELYKKEDNYSKINKSKIIKFFMPYSFVKFTNKKYIPPFYKNRYVISEIERNGLVEIFYSNKKPNKTTFKYYNQLDSNAYIEYYRNRLNELQNPSLYSDY